MLNYRRTLVLCFIACFFAGTAVTSEGTVQSQASPKEQALWNLEHAYWRYVGKNDLHAYLGLWHKNFLGWPAVSNAPVHRNHITDWITSQTTKGLRFRTIEFKPAAIEMTGDVAVTCYWLTYNWLDKHGNGTAHTIRVTHTWVNDGKDWRIVGGMSMPEPATQ